jgi:hypothetical protein
MTDRNKKRRLIVASPPPAVEVSPPVFDNAAAAKLLKRIARRDGRKAVPPGPLPPPTFDLSHRRPKKGERVVKLTSDRISPIVQPEDWQPLGSDVFTMEVICGEATLRAGLPPDAEFTPIRDRQVTMRRITDAIQNNRHLIREEGENMLIDAAALTMSHPQVGAIRHQLAGMILTYVITPKDEPGDYNWRLLIGRPKDSATEEWTPFVAPNTGITVR